MQLHVLALRVFPLWLLKLEARRLERRRVRLIERAIARRQFFARHDELDRVREKSIAVGLEWAKRKERS